MRWSRAAAGLAVLASASAASAKPMAPPRADISVAASGGQRALTVRIGASVVELGACAAAPCATPSRVPVPQPFSAAPGRATVSTVALDKGRHAIVVTTTDSASGQRWVLVAVAPLSTAAADAPPHVVWSGVASGGESAASADENVVQVLPSGPVSSLVVGTQQRAISLCGRPAILSPRILDPADLVLKTAKVQRLSLQEREGAARIVASRREAKRPPPLGRLLTAVGASSAIGSPAALTDGDPETTWSEGRGAEGRGEFATLRAPIDLQLTALSFTVSPSKRTVEGGVAPRRMYVVTDGPVFELILPEDGFQRPGAVYDVTLPAPVATSCVALVLDDAYVPASAKVVNVTLAEVEARSAFDDTMDLPSLVGALRGGDARSRAAAAVLVRGGPEARRAVTDGYSSLDDAGRLLALDAADQAPCEESAALYTRALGSAFEAEANHGRTRIERCRRGAVPALLAALRDPAHPARVPAADELSLVAPDEAVRALAPLADDANALLKKGFRRALARAASSPRSGAVWRALLADTAVPARLTLLLLAVAEPRFGDDGVAAVASAALLRVATADAGFPQRFLALAPAATLAARGDAGATSFLASALTDPNPHLRAQAARFAGRVPSQRATLGALAGDADPRVREAVGLALGDSQEPAPALVILARDEWTFVRIAAYDALASRPAEPEGDGALVSRLTDDRSPLALPRAIDAVAARNIASAASRLRALAADPKEAVDVRGRAVRALGHLCDRESLELLTGLARRGGQGTAPAEAQALAGDSIVALGRLHPRDLADRLAPFTGEGAPRALGPVVKAALADKDVCR